MTFPTHRVLGIPELLDMIFGFLDPQSNVANTQVCKMWLNIALDVLWKDVNNLQWLFGLLSPLKGVGKTNYEFERLPDANDWKRFERYASRVRQLRYHGVPKIKQSVFDDIARTRRRLEILPNLHTLDWNAQSLNLCGLFMHSGIKNFVIYLPTIELPLRPFFQEIADRMPNLLTLDIRSHIPVRSMEEDLAFLLQQLPKLHKVTFPRFYFTTNISRVISQMKHVSTIEFQYKVEQGTGDSLDIASFNPTFTEGAFPALYDLSMSASFDDATRFVKTPFSPNNLTIFFIDSERVIEAPDSVQRLLTAVSEHFQLVKELYIVSARNPSVSNIADEESEEFNNTMEILKPVFKLPNLTAFEIVHQYPLLLTQQDIEAFASSCPAIETLLLNTEPVYLTKSTLTLEALVPLARHCPRLKVLGLFVDATNVPEASPTTTITPFARLRRLSMGVSIIDDEAPPALYLSQLLAPECEIECGITWDDCDEPNEMLNAIVKERCELWGNVNCMVPMLSKLRIQERQRTHAMERELEDLRMRTAVLRDSMAMGVRLDLSTCVLI